MDSLLVGIPHSIDCDGAVDAGSMLTRETSPPAGRSTTHVDGFVRMVDGIRLE
jgi:hypothetical protein